MLVLWGVALYATALVGLGWASSLYQLLPCLVLFGVGGNLTNISVNTQAVGVERLLRPITLSLVGLIATLRPARHTGLPEREPSVSAALALVQLINRALVTAGFVGYGESPNVAVFRFAETLTDDIYRVNVLGRPGAGRTPVLDSQGATTHWVGVINDITASKRYQQELEHQSTHDALTGLPNRLLLMDRLTQAITHARRHGTSLAVMFVDLDRFKEINDRFGHRYGDETLRTLVSVVLPLLRKAGATVHGVLTAGGAMTGV